VLLCDCEDSRRPEGSNGSLHGDRDQLRLNANIHFSLQTLQNAPHHLVILDFDLLHFKRKTDMRRLSVSLFIDYILYENKELP